MNNENRIQEIVASMKSFNKMTYHKSEVLQELFNLQHELVTLTFNEDHAELSNLKIWDVEKHLEQMNDDCGGAVTESLQRFEGGCKVICNLIRSEVSGNQGEAKAFCRLKGLRNEHITLRNIEMSNECSHSELDAVVITSKGAFIVEVKNTSKNIFIDENGNFFRTGEYLRWDCNIADKMNVKMDLLREVLRNEGLEKIDVHGIVVFTNNRIEVRNHYTRINTCFLNQLPYIIDEWIGTSYFSIGDMNRAAKAVNAAKCEATYPLEFDVDQFKKDFARVMAELETFSMKEGLENEAVTKISNKDTVRVQIKGKEVHKKTTFLVKLSAILNSKYMKVAGTAAVMTIAIASTVIIVKHSC